MLEVAVPLKEMLCPWLVMVAPVTMELLPAFSIKIAWASFPPVLFNVQFVRVSFDPVMYTL